MDTWTQYSLSLSFLPSPDIAFPLLLSQSSTATESFSICSPFDQLIRLLSSTSPSFFNDDVVLDTIVFVSFDVVTDSFDADSSWSSSFLLSSSSTYSSETSLNSSSLATYNTSSESGSVNSSSDVKTSPVDQVYKWGNSFAIFSFSPGYFSKNWSIFFWWYRSRFINGGGFSLFLFLTGSSSTTLSFISLVSFFEVFERERVA